MNPAAELAHGTAHPYDLTDEEWSEFNDLSVLIRRVITGRRDLRPAESGIPRQWRTGIYERNPLYSLGRMN